MDSPRRPLAALAVGLGGLALLVAAGGADLGSAAVDELGWTAVLSSSAFGLMALCGALLTRQSLGEALGLARGTLAWPQLVVLALGALGMSHLADELLRHTGLMDGSILQELSALMESAHGASILLLLLGIGIAPGIAEELLCRGLLQRAVHRRFGASAGVLISALVFGAIHMDLAQSLLALCLGCYLGAMVLATGSTRASIGAHVLNNSVAVLASVHGFASAATGSLWLNGLAALALGFGIRTLVRELRGVAPAGP